MAARSWLRRPLCLALMASQLLTACTSWKMETVPLPTRMQADPPPDVRLWVIGGDRLEVHAPRWQNDSLTGTLTGATGTDTMWTRTVGQPVAVHAHDVTGYATRHANVGASIGLTAGLIVVVVLAFSAFEYANCGPPCS